MKIFPESDYSIELNDESTFAILKLKKHTLSKEQFVANWNNQIFIGEIKETEFEIKRSKKLFGEFCVLNGKLENKEGRLKIRTGIILNIIFLTMVLFCLSGIILAIAENKLNLIFNIVMYILVMRFVFLELGIDRSYRN